MLPRGPVQAAGPTGPASSTRTRVPPPPIPWAVAPARESVWGVAFGLHLCGCCVAWYVCVGGGRGAVCGTGGNVWDVRVGCGRGITAPLLTKINFLLPKSKSDLIFFKRFW